MTSSKRRPFLTRLNHLLLRLGQRLVPPCDRKEWFRFWHAELWYTESHATHRSQNPAPRRLAGGLLRDALWLRTESLRVALSGTALLCLALLTTLVASAALPAFVFAGNWQTFAKLARFEAPRFAVASSLIFLASYANAPGAHHTASFSVFRWVRARAFFAAKVLLLLLLTFLISTDLALPLEARGLFAAMPLQLLVFVILALLGLRWSFLDGERRCKQCLRSLAAPARVGRPSWNFLEYNGTELACRDGHGFLAIPETETSWCRSSAWIAQELS